MEQALAKNIYESKIPTLWDLSSKPHFRAKVSPKTAGYSYEQIAFISGLKDAFNDVKLHMQGKKKLKTVEQLLDEL